MRFEIELPGDIFDKDFTLADFEKRMRELAVLELIRVKRMHEHEAQQMLGLERWELIERMESAGIAPTEKVFDTITGELEKAIGSARKRREGKGNLKS